MRPPALLLALAGLLCASALSFPGAAGAANNMELAVQDDPVFLRQDHYQRERALEQARALGVTWLRVNAVWSTLLGGQANETRPPAVPVYDWAPYDDLIDAAARHGIRVQLTLTGPAPAFATQDREIGPFGPKARQFARFARAAAAHFRGRIERYSIWNEGNHVSWLAPVDVAPALYRELYTAGYRAIKRTDRRAKVFIGETSPYAIGRNASPPLKFLRAVTCTTRRRGGGSARASQLFRRPSPQRLVRGPCPPLKADGYAHHPYDYRHEPSYRYRGRNNVTVGTLRRLTSTLAGLARVRALYGPRRRPLDVYLTEYGYFASTRHALGEERRSEYLPDGFALAQRHPTVRQMLQYTLVTPPENYPGSFFEMSLIRRDGSEMPAYTALQAWSERARARRQVARPGSAINLPPAPGG